MLPFSLFTSPLIFQNIIFTSFSFVPSFSLLPFTCTPSTNTYWDACFRVPRSWPPTMLSDSAFFPRTSRAPQPSAPALPYTTATPAAPLHPNMSLDPPAPSLPLPIPQVRAILPTPLLPYAPAQALQQLSRALSPPSRYLPDP